MQDFYFPRTKRIYVYGLKINTLYNAAAVKANVFIICMRCILIVENLLYGILIGQARMLLVIIILWK